jgi:hypothetical protein
MIPIPMEIKGTPKTKEEWQAAVAEATKLALDELRKTGMSAAMLEEAAREMAEFGRQICDAGDLDKLSAVQAGHLLSEMVKLGELLPKMLTSMGKEYAQKGEGLHTFTLGSALSEVVTALACLEHAQKLLKHVAECDCGKGKRVKASA